MLQDTQLINKMQLIAFINSEIDNWKFKYKIIVILKFEKLRVWENIWKLKKKENWFVQEIQQIYIQMATKHAQDTIMMALMGEHRRGSVMSMWKIVNFHAQLKGLQNRIASEEKLEVA